MHLIAGLGNPGGQYAGNRHNAGFMVLDAIAERYAPSGWRARFSGQAAEALVGGDAAARAAGVPLDAESGW